MLNQFISYFNLESVDQVFHFLFILIIIGYVIMDMFVFNKGGKKISFGSAVAQSALWVSISVLFGVLIYFYKSQDQAWQFLTAYVTEYSLSIDNIFVFILIFKHFKVEDKHQQKVLFYGIFGAFLFRAIFIFLGSALIHNFHWVLYIFGALLLYTGAKMILQKDEDEFNPEESWIYRKIGKYLRISPEPHEGRFYFRNEKGFFFTSLFLVVLMVESSDIIFAIDSIPAVFSISQDPFIVYTSNVFAIMGLRAMYFMLEGVIKKFHLLQSGISFILMFIGAKMLLEPFFKFPNGASFAIILSVLAGSVILSLFIPKKKSSV